MDFLQVPQVAVPTAPVPPVVFPGALEDEAVNEKKRKRIVACFLLINSLINFGITFYLIRTGGTAKEYTAIITSSVIDFALAIALFAQKDVLKLIFLRSVLGLLLFGGQSFVAKDWLSFTAQFLYSGYLIYFSWAKPSKKTNKFALVGVILFALFYIGVFGYGMKQGYAEATEYDQKLTAKVEQISNTLNDQEDLLAYNTDDYTDKELKDHYLKIGAAFEKQNKQIEEILEYIEYGLKNYTGKETESNLTFLKNSYMAEREYNNSMLDLVAFSQKIDFASLSDSEASEYNKKLDKVDDTYSKFIASLKKDKIN